MSHVLFIHLSTDESLGFFHVLDIMNNAATNVGIDPSFVSFGNIPRTSIADLYNYSGFFFEVLFSTMVACYFQMKCSVYI